MEVPLENPPQPLYLKKRTREIQKKIKVRSLKFHSRHKIFSNPKNLSLEPLIEHLQDKEDFLHIFTGHFCEKDQVDLMKYQSADFKPFAGSNFTNPIKPKRISQLKGLKIAAIDGGLGYRHFLGADFTLIKVAGINYHFSENRAHLTAFPQNQRGDNYCYFIDHLISNESTGGSLAGIRRALAEIRLLNDYLEEEVSYPKIILLDGSILPPPLQLQFCGNDYIIHLHRELVDNYMQLYTFCQKKRIHLVGSVKDTQSHQLIDLLLKAMPTLISEHPNLQEFHKIRFRSLLQGFSDSELMYKALHTPQRSVIFNYKPLLHIDVADDRGRDPISKNGIGYKFLRTYDEFTPLTPIATYLQLSPYDFPLRLEMLTDKDISTFRPTFDKVVSWLAPLSQINKECILPLPQIEAHLRAHLPEDEFNFFIRRIIQHYKLQRLQGEKTYTNVSSSPFESPSFKALHSVFMGKRHDRLDHLF